MNPASLDSLLPPPPVPDFAQLQQVLLGQHKPARVHLVELFLDEEVMQEVAEGFLGWTWVPKAQMAVDTGQRAQVWSADVPSEAYYAQLVALYRRLGYDYVPILPIWQNHPAPAARNRAQDTADLSRGEREWVLNAGSVATREAADAFPWNKIRINPLPYERAARHLPDGMKLMIVGSHFEHVWKNMVGYEKALYMIADEPDLIADLYQRWGQVVYDFYCEIIQRDDVGGIFHSDDLGFRTGTIVSPRFLRQHIFPWFKQYAALAHKQGKMFWLHSCGQIFNSIIEDLIEDVRIDGLHSYQDAVLPVSGFVARFGRRVAALGGVDVDKLARMPEPEARAYVREILGRCMAAGRYALGTGNSVVNYIPVRNYLAMLDEGRRWRASDACTSCP
jgi:uroporphyrinogen decarboxylase